MPRVDPASYKYVEKNTAEQTISGIMLVEPEKWRGFVFYFQGGKFGKAVDGKVPVNYDFLVLDNPTDISEEVMSGEEFTKLLGDIFVDVVELVTAEKLATQKSGAD